MVKSAWAQQALSAGLAMAKQCPISSGLPTTMTMESFERACEHYRSLTRGEGWRGKKAHNPWCDTCQGAPKEVKIVTRKKMLAIRFADLRANLRRKRPGTAPTARATTRNQNQRGSACPL